MFAIYNEAMNDSTLVSNLFIDEYMKDANDAQLKIYLYLLRCMSSGRGLVKSICSPVEGWTNPRVRAWST